MYVCASTNVCIIAADAGERERTGCQRDRQSTHIKGNVVGLRRLGGRWGGGFCFSLRASKRKDERAMKCFPLRDF